MLHRLSVSELSTYRWNFEEDVLHYHQAGFKAIGIWQPKLNDYGEEKGCELLSEHNLEISSLQWIGGFTGADGRSFRECILDGLDTIQLAADIGARTVVVIAGGRGGHTVNHAHRIVRQALKVLAEAAQAVGVHLALEPMHIGCSNQWSILNTIPHCLEMISAVGNPNLGIVFDSYHLAQDLNVLPWLETIMPFVRLVQLGDAKHAPLGEQNRCLLGHGCVPLSTIVSLFEAGGYSGYYEIEIVGREVEHLRYEQILGQAQETALTWQSEPTIKFTEG